MNREPMTNGEVVTVGSVGGGASLLAWYLSHVSQINSTLQTVSLGVGLGIGLVSLVRLLRGSSKTKNERQ